MDISIYVFAAIGVFFFGIAKGGFAVKFWLFSGDTLEGDGVTLVLGVGWMPEKDQIVGRASLNFSPKKRGVHILPDLRPEEVPMGIPEVLTKRMVLAQVMRIYDPLGILSPFTLQGKILLRSTWEERLGWDEAIPVELREKWVRFFITLNEVNKLHYPRVLKPENAVGRPTLIIFSDASDKAYGFSA